MDPRPYQQKRYNCSGDGIADNPIEKDGSMDQPYSAAPYEDKEGYHSEHM
jgi:hypothetical protein